MRNDLAEVLFIIDKSGSMSGLEKDTIGGFNSVILKQKALPGEALVTTVFFDTTNKLIHYRQPLTNIKLLTEKDYCAGGGTALLDAVGTYVKSIHKAQKEMDRDSRPARTMVVIITDGEENSSTVFSYDEVKKLLDKQQKKQGWEVIYLGANLDVAKEATRLGIDKHCAMSYECCEEDIATNYKRLNFCMSNLRVGKKIDLQADEE